MSRRRTTTAREAFVRWVPIVGWLPRYRIGYLQPDLVAGISAALTVIPQGIAYANLAGLPLQYGLYTSFMGLFTYCLLGTMSMIHIGPTSMMAILILDHVRVGGPAYAIWLSFFSGCVEILFGVLRLGTLVDFISLPVASGFSSAASVIVIVNLFKGILGLKFSSSGFLDLTCKLIQHIPDTNKWDLSLGLICTVVLIFLKKFNETLKALFKSPKFVSGWNHFGLSLIWFAVTARSAIVVLVAAVISYFLACEGLNYLTLSADVVPGLPHFHFPPLHVERDGEPLGFIEICEDLKWSIVLVPLVAILQHIAIAKSFANGKVVNATQEVITLGLCNILGSFVGAFPVTASFSRTALNVASDIKTPLASSFTGGLVLIALTLLAPTFRYIPKSTLSAVIINAVFSMIDYEIIPKLWKTKRSDLVVWFTTFFGCILLGAEYGILTGIAVSLLILLHTTAKPNIRFHKSRGFCSESGTVIGEVVIVEPDRAMYFPSVEHARNELNQRIGESGDHLLPVIFDGTLISGVDYTAAEGFKRMVDDFEKRGGAIIFTNFKDSVLRIIRSTDPPNFVHCTTTSDIFEAVQGSI